MCTQQFNSGISRRNTVILRSRPLFFTFVTESGEVREQTRSTDGRSCQYNSHQTSKLGSTWTAVSGFSFCQSEDASHFFSFVICDIVLSSFVISRIFYTPKYKNSVLFQFDLFNYLYVFSLSLSLSLLSYVLLLLLVFLCTLRRTSSFYCKSISRGFLWERRKKVKISL
jgi:hypothetical protein